MFTKITVAFQGWLVVLTAAPCRRTISSAKLTIGENSLQRRRALVSRHGNDRVSYSTLFDIGTCRSVAKFARATAIRNDRIGIGGALVQELHHELPITRASDHSFVVSAHHDRRRTVRLCGTRRGIYRRRTGLCDPGTEQRQRALCGTHRLRIRRAGTISGAGGGGTGRRLCGVSALRPERQRLRLQQRLWLRL